MVDELVISEKQLTEDEAKLRAGLQDELLYKLSYYLNKLKD